MCVIEVMMIHIAVHSMPWSTRDNVGFHNEVRLYIDPYADHIRSTD